MTSVSWYYPPIVDSWKQGAVLSLWGDFSMGNCFQEVYDYAQNVHSAWLFPSRKGDQAITPTQDYRQLNKATGFAGVEHVGNHTLRKTFGYWFYKATKDVAMLQGILNHSHPSITLRYIGITEEETNNVLKTFSVLN